MFFFEFNYCIHEACVVSFNSCIHRVFPLHFMIGMCFLYAFRAPSIQVHCKQKNSNSRFSDISLKHEAICEVSEPWRLMHREPEPNTVSCRPASRVH